MITRKNILKGNRTIRTFVDEDLVQKSGTFKRNFTQAFKDWYIRVKSWSTSLFMENRNAWWWKPAMRIQCPGVIFPKDDDK